MRYLLLILAGATTGLILSGPAGALFGVVAGFAVNALQELVGDEDGDSGDIFTESMISDDFCSQPSTGLRPGIETEQNHFDIDDGFMDTHQINPASGLPMMGVGITGFDVGGNPYGTDLSSDDIGSVFSSDDLFSSSSDDLFNTSSDPF